MPAVVIWPVCCIAALFPLVAISQHQNRHRLIRALPDCRAIRVGEWHTVIAPSPVGKMRALVNQIDPQRCLAIDRELAEESAGTIH